MQHHSLLCAWELTLHWLQAQTHQHLCSACLSTSQDLGWCQFQDWTVKHKHQTSNTERVRKECSKWKKQTRDRNTATQEKNLGKRRRLLLAEARKARFFLTKGRWERWEYSSHAVCHLHGHTFQSCPASSHTYSDSLLTHFWPWFVCWFQLPNCYIVSIYTSS